MKKAEEMTDPRQPHSPQRRKDAEIARLRAERDEARAEMRRPNKNSAQTGRPDDITIVALILVALAGGFVAGFNSWRASPALVAHHVNSSAGLCAGLGGSLDGDSDGSTVCVFTCTIPP